MNSTQLRRWIQQYGNLGIIIVAVILGLRSLRRKPWVLVLVSAIACLLPAGFLWLPRSTSQHAPSTLPSSPSPRSAHTALMEAVQDRDLARAHAALLAGADINNRDSDGQTALRVASGRFESPDMAAFLLQQGADVNLADRQGTTPLMEAARVGSIRITSLLLEAGADIEADNGMGGTALFWAAYKGNVPVVKLLLASGASVHHPPNILKEVTNPKFDHQEVIALLKKAGAKE